MDEQKSFAKRFGVPIFGLLALVGVAVGLFLYLNHMRSDLLSANRGILNNVVTQQKFTFSSTLNEKTNAIKTYAAFLGHDPIESEQQLAAKLVSINSSSVFDSITYSRLDGGSVKNTGERLNVADRDYFKRSCAGETVISDPVISKVTNEYIITFSTPVYYAGRLIAVVSGIFDAQHLSELLMPSFDGRGYTYVTTGSGQIIFRTELDSSLELYTDMFDALTEVEYVTHDGTEAIRSKMSLKESGEARYTTRNGTTKYMMFSPVEINDWYMFSIVPEAAINPQFLRITKSTTLFVIVITAATALVLAAFLILSRRNVRELSRIAFVDSLTGVANKKQFKRSATKLLTASRCKYAMVILDIDKFTVLNDTLSHACGDELLIDAARILQAQLGPRECFGRCDSDEFYILLEYTDDASVRERVLRLIALIESGFAARISSTYNLVLCAGIYVITNPGEQINSIADRARHAHRLIKGRDESGIRFYEEEMRSQILEEKEIENKMHGALENSEFLLYLQPKYYLQSGRLYGAEALVRWDTGSSSMVYPNSFIPLFERNGFVTKLDIYMLEKACMKIRGWLDAGISPIPISINFSRLHLKNPNFVENIARIADEYRIPARFIEVELTESTMLDNEDTLIKMLTKLHEHGFTLSMDDFGSGYSSLGLLKNLPVDVIKLDRTFFLDYSEVDRAITVIAGIVDMAKNLGIKTVAEGVETKEQIDFLRELGCDIVQGYYFAKPMPADDVDKLI